MLVLDVGELIAFHEDRPSLSSIKSAETAFDHFFDDSMIKASDIFLEKVN